MTDGQEVITREPTDGMVLAAISVQQVKAQVQLIQQLMKDVMIDGEHYGTIPGCGPKKTLKKPGAEKLIFLFRLDPQYDHHNEYEGSHLTVNSKCTLYHIPSGQRIGSGEGSCSTKETKYAYRTAAKLCPACSNPTIIKGKEEYGGGWLCYGKKGGCGAKYPDGDQSIESQPEGKIPNENLADQYNTVLKMANKRSLVAAVLNATAASDIFTQDVEDFAPPVTIEAEVTVHEPAPPAPAAPRPAAQARPPSNGGGAPASHPSHGQNGAVITEPQGKRFYAIAKGTQKSDGEIHAFLKRRWGWTSTRQITKAVYEEACKWAGDPQTTGTEELSPQAEPGANG